MFLAWFDDSKKAIADKIDGGRKAYQERFGYAPAVVLVSDDEWNQPITIQNIIVLHKGYIRKNNYWFGQSDY